MAQQDLLESQHIPAETHCRDFLHGLRQELEKEIKVGLHQPSLVTDVPPLYAVTSVPAVKDSNEAPSSPLSGGPSATGPQEFLQVIFVADDDGFVHLQVHKDQPLLGPYRTQGGLLRYSTRPVPSRKRPRKEDAAPCVSLVAVAAYAGNLRSDSSSPVFPVTPTCSETGPGVAAEVTGLGSHSDKRNTRSSINTKDKVEAEVNVEGRQTGKRRKRKMDVGSALVKKMLLLVFLLSLWLPTPGTSAATVRPRCSP